MWQRSSRRAVGVLLVGSTILATGCSTSSDDDQSSRSTVDPTGTLDESAPTPEPLAGLVLVPDLAVSSDDVEQYVLSTDQAAVTEALGRPDRFVLQFLPADADGAAVIRQEIWYFDGTGTRLMFDDGLLSGEQTGPQVDLDGLGSTTYQPQMFTAEMTLDELLAVTGQSGYAQQPVDSAVATDGKLIFITGAVAGFGADTLRYFETIPIDPG